MTDWISIRRELLGERKSVLPPDVPLPTLPTVVGEFNERAADPNAPLAELARIVESDAGLTCELLRQVNSTAIGLRQPANSAAQAIALLGIRCVRLFVMTSAVQRTMSTRSSKLINTQAFWTTNLERAILARRIAKLIGADGDLAFAGGMLQDFLLPVLTSEMLDDYVEFCTLQDSSPVELVAFERGRFGWDHGFAAAQMAHAWGLPDDLVCCIALHHAGPAILRDARFRATAVAAVALAAVVPDALRQVPGGLDVLVTLDGAWPQFDLGSIARGTAEEFEEFAPDRAARHRTLASRCEKLLKTA